ncbi:MAG: hypothetical protein JNJ91_00930 [Flavobacteriales bacterium]|nr:hypothetical protein [Flavobacteriales bacterium]
MGLISWFNEYRKRRALSGITHAYCMEGRVDGKVAYHLFRLEDGKFIESCWGSPKRFGRVGCSGSANVAQALEAIAERRARYSAQGFVEVEVPDWWQKGYRPPENVGPDYFEDPDFHEWDDVKVKEKDTWTHTGMYLMWLDARGFLDPPTDETDAQRLALARQRQLTPGAFFGAVYGGWFGPEEITDEGLDFTRSYYTDKGYKADYRAHVLKPRSNFYSAADTWETYDRISPVLDERYAAWKEAQLLK